MKVCMYLRKSRQDEELEKILKLLWDFDDPNATQRYLVKLIIHFVTYVMGIMYLIVLSRGRNKFLNSNELFAVANNLYDESNRFSTLASYIILEGTYGSKDLSTFSINLVRVPFDINKEIEYLQNSDMPGKEKMINSLQTASSY